MKAPILSVLVILSFSSLSTAAGRAHSAVWPAAALSVMRFTHCADGLCEKLHEFGEVKRRWQPTLPVCRELTARGLRHPP